MKAVIVCNGAVSDYNYIKQFIASSDYIISVDGGAGHLRRMQIAPHVLLGDFDSANKRDLQYFIDQGIEVYRFPVEKDMTDSELAVEIALEKGANELVFIGALGTRLDHSSANILMLKKFMDMGVKASIIDEYNYIYMYNRSFSIPKVEGYKLSLVPVSEKVTGVSTSGLKYPLNNATMLMGTSWGISNEFLEDTAAVTIEAGILLVCLSRD